MNDPNINFSPLIFLTNAGAAFALNMSVFMLIGRTSALTMNVAGVIKVRHQTAWCLPHLHGVHAKYDQHLSESDCYSWGDGPRRLLLMAISGCHRTGCSSL